MRKLISLGLLALFLSSISSAVFAGGFAACEDNKALFQELNVYGLCNAWHNADTDEDKQKFADRFEQKADFPPPWLVNCPCFSDEALEYSAVVGPSSCSQTTTFAIAKYVPNVESLQYVASSGMCVFTNNTGDGPDSVAPMTGLSAEQAQECLREIDVLIDLDWAGDCSGP